MRAQIANIEAATPSFTSYTGGNYQHCILPQYEFYTAKTNGVKVVDFVSNIVNDKPNTDVDCATTNTCGAPK